VVSTDSASRYNSALHFPHALDMLIETTMAEETKCSFSACHRTGEMLQHLAAIGFGCRTSTRVIRTE